MSMYPLILIADDDPVVHESLGLYLSSEGYEHQSAYDGQQALENAGGRAEPVGPLARAGMWAGLEMETLADRSDAHIAEIVIQGATMGVIEMTKALNSYDGADAGARDLASRFVVQQNETIDRQKVFLT